MKEYIQRRFFVTLIFSFSLSLFLLISYISYQNTQLLRFHTEQVLRSNENLLAYESFISIMKDAETGQRGYLLTNDSTYLKPYHTALDSVNVVIGVNFNK
jgi:CHASE3 domain sensor protein